VQVTGHNSSWVSPFGHPRINARLPTPQGISQAPTSFIGSRCQGIHHAPLPTCHTNHQHTQQNTVVCTRGPCVQNDQDTKRYTTLQTSHTHETTPTPPHNRAKPGQTPVCDARVHYPIIKNQEAQQPPSTGIHQRRRLMPQTPNSAPCTSTHLIKGCRRVPLVNTPSATSSFGRPSRGVLLRKEVIQPHLPVRLPCYDFVPIASPTFDGSPHKG
jgi:hypothetical protein